MQIKKVHPRNIVQLIFALTITFIGVKFLLFVNNYSSPNALKVVSRPAGVEGFLPISALVSLKAWIFSGEFDRIHPAGLVIFLAIIFISLLFKKAFCAWICPIGTISEGLARLGRFFFGRNFKLPKFLDYPLRSLKYLLLLFFAGAIVLAMTGQQAAAFIKSPYNMIADVKMLQFFQNLSGTAFVVVGALLILSVLLENFWCRYLCPYGALTGFISIFSPWKIVRDQDACIDCGACNRACPNQLEVSTATRIWSPECNGCLNCVKVCNAKGALSFRTRALDWILSPRNMAIAVVGVWLLFVLIAKLTGHWETSITSEMYKVLIPQADKFGH